MDKIRNRLVNFRVTDEELERLKTASILKQSRCLSEFARSVVLRTADEVVPHGNGNASGDDRLLSFDQRLTHLESDVQQILDTLRRAKPMPIKPPD